MGMEECMKKKKRWKAFTILLLSLHKKKKHFVWKEKTVFLIFYDCILNSEWRIIFSFEIKTWNGAWCTKNFFCFKFNLFCKLTKLKKFLNVQTTTKKKYSSPMVKIPDFYHFTLITFAELKCKMQFFSNKVSFFLF